MTAEIAILNKHGVALAADSKVTIGNSAAQKTYDTVNKLFTLSKVHPVGAMVFGNAEFMQYPWETIVKMYRHDNGDKSFATLEHWSSDFLKFLRSFGHIRELDKQNNIYQIITSWFEYVETLALRDARQRKIAVPSDDYVKCLAEHVEKHRDRLAGAADFPSQAAVRSLVAKYAAPMGRAVDDYFGSFDDGQKNAARELGIVALFTTIFSPRHSGIVIAGYGEKEYFPTLIHYNTDGYIGSKIKLTRQDTSFDVSRDEPAAIIPFAQKEMVHRFMDGIDPGFHSVLMRIMQISLEKTALNVLEKFGKDECRDEATKGLIRTAAAEATKELIKTSREQQAQKFSEPILHMVMLLPKDELPHLAESLVALTSLKRHVSQDAETVGGPIDVALISKGDGFIWIKRKHYFKAELNPHFERIYLRGLDTGGTSDGHSSNRGRRAGTKASQPQPSKGVSRE